MAGSITITNKSFRELRKKFFHANAGEGRILDLGPVRVELRSNVRARSVVTNVTYLNGTFSRNVVRKIASVEITLERSNGKNDFR